MKSRKVVDLRAKRPSAPAPRHARAASPEKRPSSLRTRRRRARIVVFGVGTVAIALFVYGVHFASYLPRYTIGDVHVEGVEHLSSDEIRANAQQRIHAGTGSFLSPANIFIFDGAALARDIAVQFPRVASASVSRASLFATAITVHIAERQPYALWCANNNVGHPMSYISDDCYLMDESGFIFDRAASTMVSTTSSVYIFSGDIATSSPVIGQTFAGVHIQGLKALLTTLARSGLSPLGANIGADGDFSVPLSEGFYIKASFGEDADTLVQNLRLILSSDELANKKSQIEYIDLRFGNRVYYKLKGEARSANSTRQ